MTQNSIPTFSGKSLDELVRWARTSSGQINEALRKLAFAGAFHVWNEGCLAVPDNTTIAGAEELVFDSPYSGNGTLIITGVGFEGGVTVALNGTELGTLSDADTTSEIKYEVQVSNLVEGLNSFKIWSTNSDTGELRRLEVWRNFAKEDIDTAGTTAEWGTVTGAGKPDDNATRAGLQNPDFESGDLGWSKGAGWTIVQEQPFSGSWAGKFSGEATTNKNLTNTKIIAVEQGDRILAQGKIKKTAGPGQGIIQIRWSDAAGTFISASDGNAITGSTYAQSRVVAVAPSGAERAEIRFRVESTDGTSVLFVDQAQANLIPKDIDIDSLQTTNGPAESGADVTEPRLMTLVNPGFEAGKTGWDDTSKIINSTADARTGDWAMQLQSFGASTETINNTVIQVEPGDRVLAQAFTRRAGSVVTGGRVKIRWEDATGGFVDQVLGTKRTSTSYEQSRAVGIAPANTVRATIRARAEDGDSTGDSEQWFDGFSAWIIPKDTDIDALLTTNGPAESGAEQTTGKSFSILADRVVNNLTDASNEAKARTRSRNNIIENPGAEDGVLAPHDVVFTGGGSWQNLETTIARSGEHVFRYVATGGAQTSNARLALNGSLANETVHAAVAEGDQIYFETWVRNNGGGVQNRVRTTIRWRDLSAGQIFASLSTALTTSGSYQIITLSGTAPAGVAYAELELEVLNDGNDSDILFDDLFAIRRTKTDFVEDEAITAPATAETETGIALTSSFQVIEQADYTVPDVGGGAVPISIGVSLVALYDDTDQGPAAYDIILQEFSETRGTWVTIFNFQGQIQPFTSGGFGDNDFITIIKLETQDPGNNGVRVQMRELNSINITILQRVIVVTQLKK